MGKSCKPTLLPFQLVRQHRKSCTIGKGKCGLCRWSDFKDSWQKQLQSKWLHVSLKGKVAKLGCSACALAETGGPWANFEQSPLKVKLFHLKRHEASCSHQAASQKQGNSTSAVLAPPKEEFADALKHMRSGGSCRDGGPMSDKKQQMRWCLSEAAMEVGRELFMKASAVAVTRDERKGRLLVRWRACLDDLSCTSGVLGFAPVEGFADNLADCVKAMVQSYCTPKAGLPRGFHNGQNTPAVEEAVERNIKEKTCILVTDAAAPELLASGLLAGRRPYASSSAKDEYFPAVKVIGRDAPHATTRLLKRPFGASSELQAVMTEFISGSDSFAQKIYHSPLYMSWWQEKVKNDVGGPVGLCAAKHRFASYVLPLGRVTDNMASMIRVCEQISLVRGTQAEWASKLLLTFNGRKAVLLALATDAATTVQELTRALDDEDADVSQLNARCQHFALSVQALFLSEKVWSLPTYTKALVDSLEANPIHILHQGSAKAIRITDADRRYGIKVLQAGCRMILWFLT